jgi:hypothetical protein
MCEGEIEGWVWCCGGRCWEWSHHYGDEVVLEGGEGVKEVEVGDGLESLCLGKESEGEEKRGKEGVGRDEWECDFCGSECFCKYQKFAQ